MAAKLYTPRINQSKLIAENEKIKADFAVS
jgi:hypothetical protein